MSQAPAGQSPVPAGRGGQTAAPPEPDGTPAPAPEARSKPEAKSKPEARSEPPPDAAFPPQPEQASGAPPEEASVPAAAAGRPRAGHWTAFAARYAPVGAVAVVMAVLGVWGLARSSSMGNDEVATRWAALLSLHNLAHLLNTVDAVHGFYYVLMHGWMAVGTSPVVMRIPSVIAMVVAVALTAILARRLTGSGWTALFAGLVMALTPVISYYAQTARSYAMVMACVLGSTLVLLRALEAEKAGASGAVVARRWVAYGALVTLGGYLNELSLLVLAAHAVTVLLARYERRVVLHWATSAVVGGVLVLPLIVISVREHAAVSWIPRPGLADLRTLLGDYFGPSKVVAALLLACAIIAVLPSDAWWRRRREAKAGAGAGGAPRPTAGEPDEAGVAAWWSRGGVSLPSVAAPLLVVPAVLLLGESVVAPPLYVDRYVLYGEAGAALLAGAGMYRIGQWLGDAAGRRALLWVPGVVVCLCALLLQFGQQQRVRMPDSRSFDFGGPAHLVGANARPGDGVLFFGSFFRKARLGYPADFTNTSDFAMAISPTQAGDFRGTDKPPQVTIPLMLGRQRIWVIGRMPSAGLKSPALQAESAALKSHFSLIRKRRFRGMDVTLWLRR